jgi:hypothetical protein
LSLDMFSLFTRSRCASVVALLATLGCGGRPPADPTVKPARMAPPDPVITCSEWVQRAVANPELAVERVPEPTAFDPPPIPKRLPKGVLDKNGHAEVKIRVLVDTLGVADMRTFTVVTSTHPTLTRSVRAAVAKWKFTPAEVNGCKVPRNYNWGAVAGGAKAGAASGSER